MSATDLRRTILNSIQNLNVWKRGGQRAPHKPLLILLALGRLQRGEDRLAAYPDIENKLAELLREFGPPREAVHPEYPFWRLQRDGLWEVVETHPLRRRESNTDPLASELRRFHIPGGFPEHIDALFRQDPSLVAEVAFRLLQGHFPESLHGEILAAVGLDALGLPAAAQAQLPFREAVLDAYGHSCALCGYDVRLGQADLALGAAHIRWRPSGGPDRVENGLALCAIHHRAFDRGALTLDTELRIEVSPHLRGATGLQEHFTSLNGRPARLPRDSKLAPSPHYLRWHHQNVFWSRHLPSTRTTSAGA
jgi:putative restriction endonuclease